MKKILLGLLLYTFLIAMIISTILIPGSLARNQPSFFRYFTIWMTIVGSLWAIKSTFFMLLAPWYTYVWERRKRYFAQRNYRPLVSIIIPAWNEEVGLVSTIKTILASSYRPLEVIIVNDGSTDQSDEIMRAFIQKYQLRVGGSRNYAPVIYHYHSPNSGKGASLNKGISLSHGEIIISFDADCAVHENAVEHFVSYFADPNVMAAAGNIRVGNTKTILGLVQSLEYYFSFQNKKAEALLGIVLVIGGAASAFRREVFDRLGGYDAGTLTEDMDLSLRIQEAGMRIVYAPEAIVHTEGPTILHGLLKQRLRWKRGRIEAFHMHRSSFFSRKKVNKPFFWIILPLVILEDIETVLGTIYIILLYLYSFLTHDFSFLLLIISITIIVFFIQLNDDKYFENIYYFTLVPLVWFLLHIKVFIDLISLFRAIYTFYRKSEVKWQKWQRTGVTDS